jgi:PAS domain-containing protein
MRQVNHEYLSCTRTGNRVMSNSPASTRDLADLSPLAPTLADVLGLLSNDIALVLDPEGVIQKVVLGGAGNDSIREASANWVGRALRDTVTDCTRGKVDALLRDLSSSGVSRPRQVNHPFAGGVDIPVTYTAVRLGGQGTLVAVGRDLRAVSAIQQRLIGAQQEMERSYWKQRQAGATPRGVGESRQSEPESMLLALVERTQDAVVITSASGRVLLGNPAFASLLELDTAAAAAGQPLRRWLDPDGAIAPRVTAVLLRDGTLPVFDAELRTERGTIIHAEISVTLLPGKPERRVGFILRATLPGASRAPADRRGDEPMSQVH